jgi:CRP-like cAMP-binding protein
LSTNLSSVSERPDNAFLRSISAASYAELVTHLSPVRLPHGDHLYRPGDAVAWVYFPVTALLSVLTETGDGQSVETAMVGNEGVLGVVETMGSGITPTTSLVQVDGVGFKVSAPVFKALVLGSPDLLSRVFNAIEVQLTESRQSGMCQALHTVEPRFARWLLESMDRSGGRTNLPLTQEFIAAMLGVQRTTVSAFAIQIQKAGLISYARGSIKVVDPSGLEHLACECRTELRRHRARIGLEPRTVPDQSIRLVSG